jgi:hypothetical protein
MHLEVMTHSESVHLCAEFNKLVYKPCSRIRAALEILTKWMITIVISCLITVDYYYAHVNAIHYPYYN